MAVRSIDKSQWNAFLAGLSDALIGKRAEIEVGSLDLGDQILVERLPLVAISYDPRDDLISVRLESLDHLIRSPRELYVDVGLGGLSYLEVVDGEGARQIIKLTDPLALPDPDSLAR
ncbi:DUF5335 family protein [Altererythrobacter sp. Root672]|uniref:DUF5335 family protein n=1 Tax=Altererythrobacter sp. Root672 TaxID=1736584 RepID=UPI0006FB1411|nr:DUF5335 family protein [Altererythrobacter sp. Root672]KRA84010.1 hypothetical protein ASD76_08400 [Altererythrobacter sp. Root672]